MVDVWNLSEESFESRHQVHEKENIWSCCRCLTPIAEPKRDACSIRQEEQESKSMQFSTTEHESDGNDISRVEKYLSIKKDWLKEVHEMCSTGEVKFVEWHFKKSGCHKWRASSCRCIRRADIVSPKYFSFHFSYYCFTEAFFSLIGTVYMLPLSSLNALMGSMQDEKEQSKSNEFKIPSLSDYVSI